MPRTVLAGVTQAAAPLTDPSIPIAKIRQAAIDAHSLIEDVRRLRQFYRNRRPDYLKAFWENLINWDYVNEMFQAASK